MSKKTWALYGGMALVGAAIAFAPFAVGGFTVAGASAAIADFVALPVANAIFGGLLSAVGTWGSLAIVSALPLALTGLLHGLKEGVSTLFGKSHSADGYKYKQQDLLGDVHTQHAQGNQYDPQLGNSYDAPGLDADPHALAGCGVGR